MYQATWTLWPQYVSGYVDTMRTHNADTYADTYADIYHYICLIQYMCLIQTVVYVSDTEWGMYICVWYRMWYVYRMRYVYMCLIQNVVCMFVSDTDWVYVSDTEWGMYVCVWYRMWFLYMCLIQTGFYVSAYHYVRVRNSVRILLYLCPHTNTFVRILFYMCPHTFIFVRIPPYTCPQ